MAEANKELLAIASELKGIRNILASIWHSRYSNDETDQVSPEIYAEEYISTEECARRLGVTDQTIRNWILQGKKKQVDPRFKGWVQGVHYIVIPVGTKKEMVRIPWNQLILSYSKGPEASLRTFDNDRGSNLYENKRDFFETLQEEKG